MDYYNEIKQELINNEAYKRVKDYSKNKNDLRTYYNVGKLIIEAQGGDERARYGDNLIKEYSEKLTEEIGRGYSARNLKNMRKFYLLSQKGQAMPAQLTWSHYNELFQLKRGNEISYYIKISLEQNLSYRELHRKLKNKEYERLDDSTKEKLSADSESSIETFIKNPILIKNNHDYQEISEKILKQLIIEDLDNFLTELGEGFTYIKSEHKIKLGDRYNYIDLLLFNIKYNCYVVVELKITELRAENIGQIQKYMNYIDKNIKTMNQDKTIGIIICKKDNHFIMEYCSDIRIFRTIYVLN